eukprot:CAMPEP_0170528264 /NCGR_PEP_ID=MMETSP0209-20121228/13768_1 /TAXON_ID=665100 ORGANISM="Litonotus pictus, Strain P1" /NCGR_SAMPLE_ID=MMETSP0209 /ASSEMBLY_ACC=CAM_ASM_000301 /LENGTH=256 /DNA_ID=CAMNT_0010819363 /DNA_START=425 /DNA_END=1191 /DNA_ORIENTATION=+
MNFFKSLPVSKSRQEKEASRPRRNQTHSVKYEGKKKRIKSLFMKKGSVKRSFLVTHKEGASANNLVNLKSVYQCENHFFPYKEKDYQKLGQMKNFLKSHLNSIKDPFYQNLENRVNFLHEGRKVPNLKAMVNSSLNLNNAADSIEHEERSSLDENDEQRAVQTKILRIEHPNIINPKSLIQLNILKREKQKKMDEDKKLKALKKDSNSKKNKLTGSINEYKKNLRERYNQDEDMLGYFKYKLKKFVDVSFERGREG